LNRFTLFFAVGETLIDPSLFTAEALLPNNAAKEAPDPSTFERELVNSGITEFLSSAKFNVVSVHSTETKSPVPAVVETGFLVLTYNRRPTTYNCRR